MKAIGISIMEARLNFKGNYKERVLNFRLSPILAKDIHEKVEYIVTH